MNLLIVGGVAGGASAAARARRLSEDAHIVLFERGPDVSFANCGLHAIEVKDFVTGEPTQVPLAGPANRQGRMAADHIFGRDSRYRGTQGTAIVRVFERTAAMTGASEKVLKRANRPYRKVYVHPTHHAGYYPGAEAMTLKLLFDPETGKVLGAQAVGGAGVDKRIDVLAVAIQAGMTVFDLEEMELAYSPQYGSAKDPINMVGFVAGGLLRGEHPQVDVEAVLAALPASVLSSWTCERRRNLRVGTSPVP
jgi:NADPH-dependent 2,4-dienoyl-CoA reductase/sulfur reductase-like enzyme